MWKKGHDLLDSKANFLNTNNNKLINNNKKHESYVLSGYITFLFIVKFNRKTWEYF